MVEDVECANLRTVLPADAQVLAKASNAAFILAPQISEIFACTLDAFEPQMAFRSAGFGSVLKVSVATSLEESAERT